MIWRIFNLGKGDATGMQIYLDPETLRENHKLEFSAHTWAVKPLTKPGWPTETVRAKTERGGDTGTNDARKDSGSANFGGFGSSASESVPGRSDWAFGPSTLESQTNTESLGPGSGMATSINKPSTQSPPRTNLSGTTKSPSTLVIFPASDGVSSNNDTPKSSSLSLFGSDATASNSDVSKVASKGGLFGASATVAPDSVSKTSTTRLDFGTPPSMSGFSGFGSPPKAVSTGVNSGTAPSVTTVSLFDSPSNASSTRLNVGTVDSGVSKVTFPSVAAFSGFGPPPRASSPGFNLGTIVNNDASKGTSSSASGFGGFGFSTSTTSETPSGKGLFGSTEGNHSSKSSEAPPASTTFGTKSVYSNREHLKSKSSTPSLGTVESQPPATTSAFGANPSRADAKTHETTTTAEVQHSSSTTTRPTFGTPAISTESPLQNTTGRPALGASSSTTDRPAFGASSSPPRAVFGAKSIASTSQEADGSRTSTLDLRRAPEVKKEASLELAATEETSKTAETQPAATADGSSDETQSGDE